MSPALTVLNLVRLLIEPNQNTRISLYREVILYLVGLYIRYSYKAFYRKEIECFVVYIIRSICFLILRRNVDDLKDVLFSSLTFRKSTFSGLQRVHWSVCIGGLRFTYIYKCYISGSVHVAGS